MAGIEYRKDWDVLASYFAFKELASAPATPETNVIRFYGKDDGSGISTLCYKNDAGNEVCMPTSGTIVTGAGVVNRLAYWTSASVIDDVPRTFTAGSVLFAHSDFLPQEDNTNFFWDDTNNILAVGSPGSIHGATTTTRVSIERDATCILEINAHVATGTTFAGVDFYRSQGTHAAPSALGGNDFVGSLRGKCYDGNSYEDVARILFTTGTTAPADGATPGTILFQVTPPASVTPTERFRMAQSGEFGIGGANFGTSGQVFTSGGVGAAPSWAAPATQTSTLLDGSVHTDTVAQTVSRGSLIYGNATPKWDKLVVGSAGAFLRNDGTDAMWSTLILPNAATSTRIVYASAANTYGESADLTYDGTDLAIASGKRFRMQGQNRTRYLNIIALATKSASQSVSNMTSTMITWNAEDIDTDTVHDNATNNSRFTALIAGKYVAVGSLYWTSDLAGVGSRILDVYKNGTFFSRIDEVPVNSAASSTKTQGQITMSLAASDYIEFSGFQNSGISLNVYGDDTAHAVTYGGLFYIGE